MKEQHYHNHIQKHPLFHYFLLPVSLLLIVAAVVELFRNFSITGILLLLLAVLMHLAIFITRDYAKKNQDRIIRAEMRLRHYRLTGTDFEKIEATLSTAQIAALRFAPDQELANLLQQTQDAKLSPGAIKKQIQQWKPDHMRV